MANIKKLNGYDIIDSKMYRAEVTINSLVLGEENGAEVTLPTGWSADDTFILGGYYKLFDTNDELVIMRHIYSSTYDVQTGDVNTSNEVVYFNNKIYVNFDNEVSAWVGCKVEFTILLYNKD